MSSLSVIEEARIPHRTLILAGLAGATAEVIWVGLFCALTPLSGAEVLRQITASIFPVIAGSSLAPVLGLLLHFALGIVVAYAFAVLVWQSFSRRAGTGATLATALTVLATIWALNFLALLPFINPEFIKLMPYTVTFASKVLFGLAMAATLNSFELGSQESMPSGARPEEIDPLQIFY